MSDAVPRWAACELHAHSVHSDGRLTVLELARYARDRGLDLVALTDHNAISGHREIPAARREAGVAILPGMELTTFYGHLVALGAGGYVEWRGLSRASAGEAVDAIHASGGLAGVAHPFRPGSPFCTGCYWDFESTDWEGIDYLEAWSEEDPQAVAYNAKSFAFWTGLLDAGLRVSAVAGRDYHGPGKRGLEAVTYLGYEPRDGEGAALEALRRGRAAVSLGPFPSLEIGRPGATARATRSPRAGPTSSPASGSTPRGCRPPRSAASSSSA
jgi:hypothetical protein